MMPPLPPGFHDLDDYIADRERDPSFAARMRAARLRIRRRLDMMPPLPQPFDRVRRRLDPTYTSLYTEAQMLAYGRAVAEAKDAEIAALRRRCQTYRRALRQLNKAHNTLWRVLQIRTERIDAALAKEPKNG